MTPYLGFDVLDDVMHNMRDSIREAFERRGDAVSNPTGRALWDDRAGVPTPRRTFEWYADGRAEIALLRTFLDARKGRLVPFWVPTFTAELPMVVDATFAQSSIRVTNVLYGRLLFPVTARKYLALVKPNGQFLRRKATLVVDNGDGTETITLDAGLGENLPKSTLVSYLVLCRLDEDQVVVRYANAFHAEASIPFREIPREVPA